MQESKVIGKKQRLSSKRRKKQAIKKKNNTPVKGVGRRKKQTRTNYRPPGSSKGSHVPVVRQEPDNLLSDINRGSGKVIFQASGGDLRDSRIAMTVDPSLHIINQNTTVQVQVPTTFDCVNGIITAMISHAVTCGYYEYLQQTYNTTNNIGYVYQYIGQLIESVLQGGIQLPRIEVPRWLNDLLSSLTAKSNHRFGSGHIGYKFNYQPVTTYNMQYTYPSSSNKQFVLGQNDDSVDGNGYVIQVPLTLTYTETLGGVAFNDYKTYMQSIYGRTTKAYNPWQLVNLDVKDSFMSKDVSVYAFNSPIVGVSNGVGAPVSLVSNEVFINCPNFSCFASNNDNNRAFRNHKPMSGDTNSLFGSFTLMDLQEEYKNKNYVMFKFVDLGEIIYRALILWQDIFTKNGLNTNNQIELISGTGFPFTIWDFAILIRHMCMDCFGSTQFMVQSQLPIALLNITQTFYPLLCATNTAPRLGSLETQWPMLFIENLKALRGRKEYKNVIPGQQKPDLSNPTFYLPVLGLYADFALDATQWTFVMGGNTINMFTTTSGIYDLVAGTNENNAFVDLDMSPVLYDYAMRYNEVATSMSPYIENLSVFTPEQGINALTVIGMTFSMGQVTPETRDKKRKDSKRSSLDKKGLIKGKEEKKEEKKEVVKKKLGITIENKLPISWTSQQPLLGPLAPIQKIMIIPELPLYDANASIGSITPDLIRTVYLEPCLYRFTNQTSQQIEQTTMDQLRKLYVQRMVHSFNSQNNELTRNLISLSQGGHGGIFNAVMGAFNDALPLINTGVKIAKMLV